MGCRHIPACNDGIGYYIIIIISCTICVPSLSLARSPGSSPLRSSANVCRPTPRVEWKKKDGSLEETGGRLENHNRWLHFDSVGLEDDGEYECRASNSHGATIHSFTVTVEGRPDPRRVHLLARQRDQERERVCFCGCSGAVLGEGAIAEPVLSGGNGATGLSG